MTNEFKSIEVIGKLLDSKMDWRGKDILKSAGRYLLGKDRIGGEVQAFYTDLELFAEPEFDRINHGPFEHPVAQVVGNERFEITSNAEGTVISIDGHPIQFSIVLTDAQIAKYIATRRQNDLETQRRTEELWLND